jgi:zinc transporter ZupT
VSAQSADDKLGLLVIVSLAIHNIPEGIATSLLLIARGMSIPRSSLFAILANLPQPLIAVPAYLFMDSFRHLLPVGFCFASGAMTYIVCTELIPESIHKLEKHKSLLYSTFFSSIGLICAVAFCAKDHP